MLKKPNYNEVRRFMASKSRIAYQKGHYFFRQPVGISVLLHLSLLIIILISQYVIDYRQTTVNSLTNQTIQIINAKMVTEGQVLPAVKKRPKPVYKKKKTNANTYNPNFNRLRAKKRIKPKPKAKNISNLLKKLAMNNMNQSMAEESAHKQSREKRAKTLNSQAMRYMLLLQGLVRENWTNPFSRDLKLSVTLKVIANNEGQVRAVSVVLSSGNPVFDRQAIIAVRRTSPLPLPKDKDLLVRSRVVNLTFNNQDSTGVQL